MTSLVDLSVGNSMITISTNLQLINEMVYLKDIACTTVQVADFISLADKMESSVEV